MPLQIIRHDITKMNVDAIINPTDARFSGLGGTDLQIHTAAGSKLAAKCRRLGGCRVGEAKATSGYLLPCKYIIHTVGPVWRGGQQRERELLSACYTNALSLAVKKRCQTVAAPLIASGTFGFPKELALQTAIDAIGKFLLREELMVYLVVYDKAAYQISQKLFTDIAAYIDETYVAEHTAGMSELLPRQNDIVGCFGEAETIYPTAPSPTATEHHDNDATLFTIPAPSEPESPPPPAPAKTRFETAPAPKQAEPMPRAALYTMPRTLEEALGKIDESFTEMLLRKIDESGMTDAEVYKKANIDRKLFSKIRKDRLYRPSKPTAIAFAIALELPLPETCDLLQKAGYALSHSNPFDIIIEFFIGRGNYNIFEINEALFAFDQSLLGAS